MQSLRVQAPNRDVIRVRVEAVIQRAFGRVEEELFASGLLDSLRAVELGMLLEEEFGVQLSQFDITDLATVDGIVSKLSKLLSGKKGK